MLINSYYEIKFVESNTAIFTFDWRLRRLKIHWKLDELIEYFTFLPNEQEQLGVSGKCTANTCSIP
jgi:hypothetical protein